MSDKKALITDNLGKCIFVKSTMLELSTIVKSQYSVFLLTGIRTYVDRIHLGCGRTLGLFLKLRLQLYWD